MKFIVALIAFCVVVAVATAAPSPKPAPGPSPAPAPAPQIPYGLGYSPYSPYINPGAYIPGYGAAVPPYTPYGGYIPPIGILPYGI